MTDRQILFFGPMVRALLDGRKSQTRRPLMLDGDVRGDPYLGGDGAGARAEWSELDGSRRTFVGAAGAAVGDRLWVRETWSHTGDGVFEISQARIAPTGRVIYAATPAPDAPHAKYWPSIHMPRQFSRLTLVVTEVRVQRLQDISEADAIAEGSEQYASSTVLHRDRPFDARLKGSYREGYSELWEGLNAKRGFGWDANPWVSAITFTVHHQNIDALGAKEAA